MEAREARRQSSTTIFTAAAPAVPATSYATIDEILALAGTAFVRFDEAGGFRYTRGTFYPAGFGAADQTWRVDVYAVLPADHDGRRFALQYLGQATGTMGADPVYPGAQPKHAKTCDFASSGYAEAQSGGVLQLLPFPIGAGGASNPAGFALHDIGNAVGILLVPALGAANPVTGVAMYHERWR